MDMVQLTIDGKRVEVEPGTTVLKAARELGIEIPTMCHNDFLEPYGSCRVCVVEVKGRPDLVASCALPVVEGMEVMTDTDRVIEARKMVVELMMSRWADAEPVKKLAEELGIEKSRFPSSGDKEELCILCGNCYRVCSEIVGANALGFANRGIERVVGAPFEGETDACIACGACAWACPTGIITVEDAYGREVLHDELNLGAPTPINTPTMQAVPNVPFIDYDSCIHFKTGECKICEKVCETEAINHDMEETVSEFDVGSILVTTGFNLFDGSKMSQYGYGKYPNVISSMEFEKMNTASGPTGGKILMADGRTPESVAILHCVGSRDTNFNEYCSRVCCMYAMKFAHLIKEKTDAEVYQLYIDLRCFGKGYEEFYNRLLREDIRFIRGKAGEITDFPLYEHEKGKLIVRCEDTLVGAIRRIPVDMVVLCGALEPAPDVEDVGRMFSISRSQDGFFLERHPKLAPVSTATDGVFIAGCCQGPKDIPDTVAQASGAAANALSLIMRGEVEIEAAISSIDEEICSGCRVCNDLCPYSAIEFDEEKGVSVITEALCKGCGTCVSACPSGAITARHFTDKQIMEEIEGVLV
jgi:heterodisulfide reductase subunit A